MSTADTLDIEKLICPLTMELPTEPVVAADGIVYEHEAWKGYIASFKKSRKGKKDKLTSPITKQQIKPKVYPSITIRNIIEDAVQKNLVPDDLCVAWKMKLAQKHEFEVLLAQAENSNDEFLLLQIGDEYNYGINTYRDWDKAIKYYAKAWTLTQSKECRRKMIILTCLQEKATNTDMVCSWAAMCQLNALNHVFARDMINQTLERLPKKLRLHVCTASSITPLTEFAGLSTFLSTKITQEDKKQRRQWIKEMADFLVQNSKGRRIDDSSSSDEEDDYEEDWESE